VVKLSELSWRPRLRHSFTIGVVALTVGFLSTSALQGNGNDSVLQSARESDLIVLLDSLTQRLVRLQAEKSDLQTARQEILSGSEAEALARTREQLTAMQVLNGTIAVHGPGIIVKIQDPSASVTYDVVLGLVQELRDAGAEAIDINGVRLNGRSWFGVTESGAISVNGTTVTSPLTIKVIGSAQTLTVALQIPGGVADTVASLGARLVVVQQDDVTITTTVPTP
jgi:uncharacterized protein YlxW (UPF0749 family)